MRVLALFIVLLLAPLSWSIDAESLADPVLQKRYQSIIYELRCLVCQNQSIQDSDAQLAKDLRRQVREMLRAGRSDLEIMDYMVERYGDYVRYRPALSRSNLGLYLAPAIVALLGLVMLGTTLRRHLARDNQFDGEQELSNHEPGDQGKNTVEPSSGTSDQIRRTDADDELF